MTAGAPGTLAPGDEFDVPLVECLTRTQIVQYAGASGDFNPLHTDEPYARDVAGHPGVFAHGMLTMGMTARLLTDLAGVGSVVRMGCRFVAQVWPGDSLRVRATVDEVEDRPDGQLVTFRLSTVNGRSEEVLSGTATVRLGAAEVPAQAAR